MLVAAAKDAFSLWSLQLPQQIRRSARPLERVRPDDFLGRIAEYFAEDFGGLQRAQPGTCEHRVGFHAERTQSKRGRMTALDSLGRERPLGVGWAMGVFAVHGDAVAHEINEHQATLAFSTSITR